MWNSIDWLGIIQSIVGVCLVLMVPLGWIIKTIISIDKRTVVLETKVLLDSQKLDAISFKVDVVSSDINHIRIGIAELKVAWVQRHEDEKRRQKDIRHKESIDR